MGLRGFSGWIQVTVDRMGLELEWWWFSLPRVLRTALREAQMQVHARVGARDCSSAGQDLLLSPDVRRRGVNDGALVLVLDLVMRSAGAAKQGQ
jgi:hypothetical protein